MTGTVRDTRRDQLAEIVQQFTQPRPHTETLEHRTRVVSRNGRTRSTVLRYQHRVTLPSVWASLELAAYPACGEMGPSGGFESQPAANMTALSVMVDISDHTKWWCCRLDVRAPTQKGRMARLVSAHSTDHQLGVLLTDAGRWLHDALVAVGEEEPLRTVNAVCPMCSHRNVLEMRSDGGYVRCKRCDMSWDEATVGLLAAMLANNRTHTVLAAG